MKRETKHRLHQIELFLAIGLVIVLIGVISVNMIEFPIGAPSLPIITGHVPSDVISQDLNINIDRSQEYIFATDEPLTLTSLRLGGIVEGGPVKIYLETNGDKYLIYTNIKEKQETGNLITGQAINLYPDEYVSTPPISLTENQEAVSGAFYEECIETCFINLPLNPDETYRFLFYVEEGVNLRINKLTYTFS